jgi:hypothetical protein
MFSFRLIHSALSKEDISRAVNDYFCSILLTVDDDGNIAFGEPKTVIGGFRVRNFKGRWRFERLKPFGARI